MKQKVIATTRLLSVIVLVAGALVASSGSAQAAEIAGRLFYLDRECAGAPTSQSPVPYSPKLLLTRAGAETVTTTLAPDGSFSARIGGHGPIKGFVVLNREKGAAGPKIMVSRPPERGEVAQPFRIPVDIPTDATSSITLDFPGAVNIWATLNASAEFAQTFSSEKLPKVTAYWEAGLNVAGGQDISGTYYKPPNEIWIDAIGEGAHDEWDDLVLMHEYFHHVTHSLIVKSPTIKKELKNHTMTSVHPHFPMLPFREGTANAFAAVLSGVPEYGENCTPFAQYDPMWPTIPELENPRHVQYNETATAAVMWALAEEFGNVASSPSPQEIANRRRAGFATVVRALLTYKQRIGPPASLRELRDALIVAGLESNNYETFRRLNGIFARFDIGWGYVVNMQFTDNRSEGSLANYEIALRVDGPGAYNGCRLTDDRDDGPYPLQGNDPANRQWPRPIGAYGGLDYAWQDECLPGGGDGTPNEDSTIRNAFLWLRFPFLVGGAHLATLAQDVPGQEPNLPYALSATYVCMTEEDPPDARYVCTGDRSVTVEIIVGQQDPMVFEDVLLTRDASTTMFEFDALGRCKFVPRGEDCTA